MRPSEYLALKWPDVNFTKGAVSVARTLEPIRGGGWRFADTKRAQSASGEASGLGPQATRGLSRCSGRGSQGRKGDIAAADLIFVNSSGSPLNERNLVQRKFQVILERAKLPRIRLYDLRHTAATLALGAGVPAKVVSEQLGHASVAFTRASPSLSALILMSFRTCRMRRPLRWKRFCLNLRQ
jgi:integrase